MRLKERAFTIVEIIIIVTVITILAGISVVSYGSWRRHTAEKALQSDLVQAVSSLKSYTNFKNTYPPNLAGTGFVGSPDSALALYTDAPSVGVYETLTPDENAQLFLNTCNANLDEAGYNTACVFNGKNGGAKIHVKGTNGTNLQWQPSPLTAEYLRENCASLCSQLEIMLSQFQAQGGTLPIVISGANSELPEPTEVPNGPATRYCLSARSGEYPDIVFHSVSSSLHKIITGECPPDPELKYFP
ncbi:MAG TPA: hypothetical protein VGE13_01585 [Candidatus Saccharimonadales bacterium]